MSVGKMPMKTLVFGIVALILVGGLNAKERERTALEASNKKINITTFSEAL